MTPDDMAKLHARCFTTPRPWSTDEFAATLDQPGCFPLFCDDGFLLGRVIVDEAELLTLAIAPEHRHAGLGTHLTRGFLDSAHDRGAKQAFLEVGSDNKAAIALYEKLGFARTGTRSGYYRTQAGARIDAFVMALKIAQNSG